MNNEPAWDDAPVVETRGRFHGYRMRINLADFFQRIAYFVGGYHEMDVVGGIGACLRAGDAFIDGGANTGLITLHAAKIVGPTGRIDAFEVFPPVLDVLKWHVEANHLEDRVHVHGVGLGAEKGELLLKLPGTRSGAPATFGAVPHRYGIHQKEVGVIPVVTGDSVIPADDARPLTIKLDVEGFEVFALRGLLDTIDRRKPAILVEVNHEMLTHCGVTAGDIMSLLWPRGYHPFGLDRKGWKGGYRMQLQPLWHDEFKRERDVLWVARDSVHWERLAPIMVPKQEKYWRDHLADFHVARAAKWERRMKWLGLDGLVRWATTGSSRPHHG
jgi:FkbM family methyltransferase